MKFEPRERTVADLWAAIVMFLLIVPTVIMVMVRQVVFGYSVGHIIALTILEIAPTLVVAYYVSRGLTWARVIGLLFWGLACLVTELIALVSVPVTRYTEQPWMFLYHICDLAAGFFFIVFFSKALFRKKG